MYTFKNNLATTVSTALTNSATSVVVKQVSDSTTGAARLAAFPKVGNGDYFTFTLYSPADKTVMEIIKCTAAGSNTVTNQTFTCERGCEGTTARAWPVGTVAEHRLTADAIVKLDAPAADGSATAAPGGYGLGMPEAAQIPANTDLDTVVLPGFYSCKQNTVAATLLNCPVTTAFSMLVEFGAYGPTQTITIYNSGARFQRTKSSPTTLGTWRSLPNGISDSTSTTSSTIAASATAIKTAYDRATTATNAAAAAQSTADTALSIANAANKDYVDSRITESLGTGTDVTVNQKLITDLFTGTIKASDVYQGPYGIQYDNTSDSYVRVGAPGYTAIQSMMKRCVLKANGSVNYYLHKNNSNFKEDGTLANLTGADGEVMVQIPKVYSKVTQVGAITTIMFSLTPEEGYVVDPAFVRGGVEVPYRYFHAYRGIVVSGALRSRSGVTPTRSTTLPAFRTAARAVGTGWGITDWYLLNLVRRLCVVEFNDYIVTKHLGVGNYSGKNYGRVTGVSNTLGNNSSTPANDADDFMSYRGIEDFYADSWLCIDGVNLKGWQYFVNTSNDPSTFASDTFTGAYVATGVSVPSASNSFIKTCHESLQNGFIPTALGGSATTYFGDALWSAGGNQVLYFGGTAADGASCGASNVGVNHASSHSDVHIGAALCR